MAVKKRTYQPPISSGNAMSSWSLVCRVCLLCSLLETAVLEGVLVTTIQMAVWAQAATSSAQTFQLLVLTLRQSAPRTCPKMGMWEKTRRSQSLVSPLEWVPRYVASVDTIMLIKSRAASATSIHNQAIRKRPWLRTSRLAILRTRTTAASTTTASAQTKVFTIALVAVTPMFPQ